MLLLVAESVCLIVAYVKHIGQPSTVVEQLLWFSIVCNGLACFLKKWTNKDE